MSVRHGPRKLLIVFVLSYSRSIKVCVSVRYGCDMEFKKKKEMEHPFSLPCSKNQIQVGIKGTWLSHRGACTH